MLKTDMGKSCMNCMRMVPVYEGTRRDGQKCQLDPDTRVNGRMCCDAWLSSDMPDGPFVGAVSVSGITTEKAKRLKS